MQRMMASASPLSSGSGSVSFLVLFLVVLLRLDGTGVSGRSRSLVCWPLVARPDLRISSEGC